MVKWNHFKSPLISMGLSLIKLATPISISYLWNFGSLLGVTLMVQILSGLFLAMHYCPSVDMAFYSVIHICRDVEMGWSLRMVHANGASLFFFFMFIHVGRGIYYDSFVLLEVWFVGILILLISMGAAFMGYVLPWGQMSFWGATVITNLLSTVPYLGPSLVEWIWGGFSVDNPTLNRFFVFHFITPFIILFMVLIHLVFLHITGSNSPSGLPSNYDKVPFHPFFTSKDLLGFLIMFWILWVLVCYFSYYLGDPDNFIAANPMVTPPHIKPEWYFLFAYAILRSIPSKFGGVVALLLSILILYTLPLNSKMYFQGSTFTPIKKVTFWNLVAVFILLTWIGGSPAEVPYILVGQVLTVVYFTLFVVYPLLMSSKPYN